MESKAERPAGAPTQSKGYDFSKSMKYVNAKNYRFARQGNKSSTDDQTLANLFETLTVECR